MPGSLFAWHVDYLQVSPIPAFPRGRGFLPFHLAHSHIMRNKVAPSPARGGGLGWGQTGAGDASIRDWVSNVTAPSSKRMAHAFARPHPGLPP